MKRNGINHVKALLIFFVFLKTEKSCYYSEYGSFRCRPIVNETEAQLSNPNPLYSVTLCL